MTRAVVQRRHKKHREQRRERLRRAVRRFIRLAGDSGKTLRQWAMLFMIGAVLLAVGLVLFSPIIEVREIRVRRNDLRIDAERVQRALAPIFGRHLLFVSVQGVRDLLQENIPGLTEVALDKQYPSRLVLDLRLESVIARITIAAPDASVTAERESASGAIAPSEVSVLTAAGRYVTQPKTDALAALPEFRIVDWGVRPVPGDLLVAADLLDTLARAEHALREEFGYDVSARTIFVRAREIHLTANGVTYWFDLESPLEQHLARLKTFLATIPRGETKEYVDLRLSDRVVYR